VHATSPASLDSAALSRRLSELAGHEREVQVANLEPRSSELVRALEVQSLETRC
jgi:hypothetical protein